MTWCLPLMTLQKIAKLTEKDVSIACSGRPNDTGTFAFLDTRENGEEIMTILVQAE